MHNQMKKYDILLRIKKYLLDVLDGQKYNNQESDHIYTSLIEKVYMWGSELLLS